MEVFEAYIEESVLSKALEHSKAAAQKGREAMGLLAGQVCQWSGEKYILVEDYLTAGNSATSVSVRFSQDAFPQLAQQVNAARKKGKIIVGWCHSHPSYGCFLSGTDLSTQRKYFSEEFSVAMVVDPVRREKKVFKLGQGASGYREAGYAVIRQRTPSAKQ